jgi:hypothetical protein
MLAGSMVVSEEGKRALQHRANAVWQFQKTSHKVLSPIEYDFLLK